MGVSMDGAAGGTERAAAFHNRSNYAPVSDELDVADLKVEGAIPPSLNGVYIRNGANPRNGETAHWFFGDGMLHGVRLEGGRAIWYRNRWVRTPCYEGKNRLDMASMMDKRVSTANTHIVRHHGRLFALEEGAFPYEVTPDLETIGPHDFNGALTSAFTAHPKICPATGEMHAFGYAAMPPWLVYHVVDKDGRLTRSMEIPVRGPSMIHDFAMTRDHVIFLDLPVVFDLETAMKGGNPYRWNETYGARLGVLPRNGDVSALRWFEIAPCYVFHIANAWNDNSAIVIEACRFDSLWREQSTAFDSGARLTRWRIDLAAGRVSEERIDPLLSEFPRIDDRRAGEKHRFVYAAAAEDRGAEGATRFDRILKYDTNTGVRREARFAPGSVVGEFAFAPEGRGEDDGWLIGFVHDERSGVSRLSIVDADAMTETASIPLPRRVPYGFHGDWFAA